MRDDIKKVKLYAHTPYIGTTGYNQHARNFLRNLSELVDVKVNNSTVGASWDHMEDEPHNSESYITDTDKKLLVNQTLRSADSWVIEPIYSNHKNDFTHNVNLVLSETYNHLFYKDYIGPKIAYNVWEATLQPQHFFDKLKEFDQIWVPSQWQARCTINQGADPAKVKVVPEGVDTTVFFPEEPKAVLDYVDDRFKFVLFGRWDYRKSTKEIIETFLREFTSEEPVDLIISIDNPWGEKMDGFKTTEERLNHYNLVDDRIKIKHFPSREDYVTYLKNGHVFLSCARGEGWNLPLIEAMACGTPSIYSADSGQMEFAAGKGLPVRISGYTKASDIAYGSFLGNNAGLGEYPEPDFDDLAIVMRDAFENYTSHKQRALEEAKIIHRDFNWNRVAEIGKDTLADFVENYKEPENINTVTVTYTDSPIVNITGDTVRDYRVEFIDKSTGDLRFSTIIKTNMWAKSSKTYYIHWIIKVIDLETNELIHIHELNLKNRRVYIHLNSSAIGDTLSWFPHVERFAKKHQCKVITSTFHNEWFEEEYPELEFVEPGTEVDNVYIRYSIGLKYNDDNSVNYDEHSKDFKVHPLSQAACDILGIDFKEVKPRLSFPKRSPMIEGKYVCIAPHASAHAKYWNHPGGWQAVIDYLNAKGYKVVMITHEPLGDAWHDSKLGGTLKGVIDKTGNYSIADRVNDIRHADFFIGLGSGLSWLSWSLDTPTILISGFSKPYSEFSDCERIIPTDSDICSGCFNRFRLDAGDWEWCPDHKDTERMFECTKTITPSRVMSSIDNIIKVKNN